MAVEGSVAVFAERFFDGSDAGLGLLDHRCLFRVGACEHASGRNC